MATKRNKYVCNRCGEEHAFLFYIYRYLAGWCNNCLKTDFLKERKPKYMKKRFPKGKRKWTTWDYLSDGTPE